MTDARAVPTRVLLVGGLLAGPLFTAAWIVEGAARAGYDPLRHPISSLSIGDLGWTQMANFVLTGALMLAFAAGVWRAVRPLGGSTWGPLLLGACGVGLLGAAAFVTDPISGYPPGTPAVARQPTVHGTLHQLFSAFLFLGLPAACIVFARRFAGWRRQGWAAYSVATAVLFVAGFALTSAGFGQSQSLVALGGLLQRVTLVVGWGWTTLLAAHLLERR
jgi:hypothetical protein